MANRPLKIGFNPAAAYRLHGRRYAIYIAAQVAVLCSGFIMGILTLIVPLVGDDGFQTIFKLGMWVLQIPALLIPYLAFEALYWRYRLCREARNDSDPQHKVLLNG